jgi:hypothetical protein
MKIRTYKELLQFETFRERFEYLKLGGGVGRSTFGFDRHINQHFYASSEWKSVRDHVIVRDSGCNLAVPGHEIHQGLLIHHMNPMSVNDIVHGEDWILDPEFLITTNHRTHNAIHYGSDDRMPATVTERTPNDTRLW